MPFTPEQRQIYSYHDGTREVRADPMVLLRRWRAALAKLPDSDALLKRIGFADPTADDYVPMEEQPDDLVLDTLTKVKPAIQATFGVKDLGEVVRDDRAHAEGLTEWEQVALLGDFLTWLDATKKSTGSTPTSSTPSPAMGQGAELPTTESSSASG